MTSEVWKPIKGYEDYYEVSSFGRVRSKDRYVKNSIKSIRLCKGQIIVAGDNGNGYLYVSLNKNHKRKHFYVHRLVADHFCEHPEGKDYVNHIDYNTKNNNALNLEWCTQKENTLHSVCHMKHRRPNNKSNTGEYGISYRKSKGRYRVTVDKKERGTYPTLEEAIKARDRYLKGVV